MEHKITCELEGEGRITEPGDWKITDLGWPNWRCSCGKSFTDIEQAWDHYEEHNG